jgi:hypothetical protein
MRLHRFLLFWLVVFASCSDKDIIDNPTLHGFSKRDLSEHWILQLPNGAELGQMDSFSIGTKKVIFRGDSLFVRVSPFFEPPPRRKYDCSFSSIATEMQSGDDGICQGGGSIHIYYSPIINHTTQIAGWRGDWVSGQRRFVVYEVTDCSTGESIILDFEGVDPSKYKLIEEIINSLEFRK